MSERRINLPTKDSWNLMNISRQYRKSKSNMEINLPISETISQKAKTINRIHNNQSKNLECDMLYTKNKIEIEQSQKKPKINSLGSYISETNNNAQLEEEQNIWRKVDELIKRIKFKKYIRTFLSLSRIRLYKNLTPKQMMQINDLSIYEHSQKISKEEIEDSRTNTKDEKLYYSLLRYIKQFQMPIFLPHHYFINFWQIFKIISIAICYFCYLVALTFDRKLEDLFDIKVLFMCQICLIIDIFITVNTGIYIRGVLCTDRKEIFNYYRSTLTFSCDISSIFFTTLYYIFHLNRIDNRAVMYFLLPIVFKLNDFYVIIRKIKVKFQLDRKMQNIIELFNLMKNILFISHIFACIWIRVGLLSEEYFDDQNQTTVESSTTKGNSQAQSWIDLMGLDNESWLIQYLNSYYYIIVTMSTVGYGDIRPTNPLEVVVCVFLMITCCVMFGFTLNSIGEIFQDFFTQEKLIQEKRYIIANYMNKNHIDPNTRKSIFEYLEYYWKESIDENVQEENKIISQLSDNLKEELLIQSNKLILKESKVLKENFSHEILAKCIPIISEQKLTPGEILIDELEGNTDCSIYFVLSGELEVYHGYKQQNKKFQTKDRSLISVLKRGDSFGERSFFTGDIKSLNIRSNQFSKILKIKREDFKKVLSDDKEQYEKFVFLKDKIKFENEISYLHLTCKSCKSNLHEIEMCPSLHYIPKKMKIFGMNQISQPQSRNNKYIRANFKKSGTLECLYHNTQAYLDFLENQFDELENYEQDHLQYSSFNNKAKQLQFQEEDDLETVKNGFEFQKLRQVTTEFQESPYIGPDNRKKLSFKKKTAAMIIPSPIGVGSHPNIYQTNEESVRDIFSNMRHKSIINTQPAFEADAQSYKGFNLEQPIFLDQEFGFSSIQLSENPQSLGDKIIQNHRFTVIKRQLSKEQINPPYERTNKQRQESLTKLTQKMNLQNDHIINNNNNNNNQDAKSSVVQISEENDFDLLQGKFDKLENFLHYFPKYNFKNVIGQLNPNSVEKKKNMPSLSNQIKESQMYAKLNKNIHQLLKERDIGSCRSIPRSKYKLESECNLDRMVSPLPQITRNSNKFQFDKELKKISIQLNMSYQDNQQDQSSVIVDESNHCYLDQDQSSIKVEYDDPQTPPRSEFQIHQVEALTKVQNYNFSSLEVSSNKIINPQMH